MERSHLYGRSRTSPWKYGDYENYYKEDQEYLLGFSWPPRSYTCSFCKREFRSAQALGGHMNVHRRDRARLRLQQQCSSSSSSTPSPPYPNPNYSNYASMPTSPPLPPPLTLFPSTLSPTSSPCSRSCLESSLSPNKSRHTQEKACVLSKKDGCKFLKNDEVMSLGLEVGLINEPEEDIDLELHLGFTN